MTVGAIGVASERGVLWFGTQSNQTELAPEWSLPTRCTTGTSSSPT